MARAVVAAALVALCLVVVARADDDGVDEKHVKVLTDKNFDKYVKKGSIWLVEFYAPWCGHCKSLKPVWAEAARRLAQDSTEARLGKVDATANQQLTRRFSIQGYPTIKLFKDGKFRGNYNAGRTEDEIVKFAKQAAGSVVSKVDPEDGLHGFVADQSIGFLLVGVSAGNAATLSAFEKVAEEHFVLGDVGFGTLTDPAVLKEYLTEEESGLDIPTPSLVVFNTGEISFISSQGANAVKLDQANMEQFVKTNKQPFYPELSPSKNWHLTKEGKKTVLGFVDQSSEATDGFISMMKRLKRSMGDKLVFGWVDAPSNTFLLDPIGLSLSSLPAFVVVDIPEMTYFKSPFLTEEGEIRDFLESVHQGKQRALPINEDKGDKGGKGESNTPSGGDGTGVSQGVINALEAKVGALAAKLDAAQANIESLSSQLSTLSMLGVGLLVSVGVLAGLVLSKRGEGAGEPHPPAPAVARSRVPSKKHK